MSNQARGYTLPITLLERVEKISKTRSEVFTDVIRKASKNPQTLLVALQRRMGQKPTEGRNSRVTVSLSIDTIQSLSDLTFLTQLGTEHVLRLALEDYLYERQKPPMK